MVQDRAILTMADE